jgi:hypothetical protein
MLKELIEYLAGIQTPKEEPFVTIEGENYKVVPGEDGPTVGDLIRLPAPIATPTLKLATLTGFVDAFTAKIDAFPAKVGVHVIDHLNVALISLDADEFGRRHEYLRATCSEVNPFPFNSYQQPEPFILSLQSGFLPTDNTVKLQRLASSLTSENSIGVQDDGLSQVVTVKAGTVTRETVALPPRIDLFAYRTFREIDPVRSDFMVRLKGKPGEIPTIALLEIDGGKWKLDSMLLVAKWLQHKLPEATVIA